MIDEEDLEETENSNMDIDYVETDRIDSSNTVDSRKFVLKDGELDLKDTLRKWKINPNGIIAKRMKEKKEKGTSQYEKKLFDQKCFLARKTTITRQLSSKRVSSAVDVWIAVKL